MELKLLLHILRKRMWLIITFVLLCTVGTAGYSIYMVTPIYEAESTLIVNKSNLDSEGKPSIDVNEINSNIMLINSYKVILGSAAIMDKVVQRYPELKETSKDLIDRIKVDTAPNSQIISLKIRDESYTHAMQIVNAVSHVFKEQIPSIMKVDNITILDEAKPQEEIAPVSPRITLNIVIAFVASLLVSIGIVLFIEYLDDTVKTDEDVERYLGLTTLGVVAKMKKRDVQIRSKARSKKQAGEKYASLSQ